MPSITEQASDKIRQTLHTVPLELKIALVMLLTMLSKYLTLNNDISLELMTMLSKYLVLTIHVRRHRITMTYPWSC